MGRQLRILCTGDLHVGRRPSHIRGHADSRRCSCAAMFGQVIEYAIDQKVDAVVLSGDVVDRENRFYEAYGPVERGLRRLGKAGIDAFAVAGNHDFDVLPKLAEAIGSERFHFLGGGGKWQGVSLHRDGAAVLEIVGWSFPAEHVSDSPLRAFERGAENGIPTLGLLHADVDQPRSEYAPVGLSELQRVSVDAWLLGHVHKPQVYSEPGRPLVLNPGSPQAMDPGETGTHGPWLVEVERGHVTARQIPLSRVRYDVLAIDLTGIDSEDAFRRVVPQRIHEGLGRLCSGCVALEYCSCRLRFVGRTRLYRRLRELCTALREELELRVGEAVACIDGEEIEVRPAIELESLAKGSDIAAELARMLLQLKDGTLAGEAAELIQRMMEEGEEVCTTRAYQQLRDGTFESESARQMLVRQGTLMLDALLAQKEGQ